MISPAGNSQSLGQKAQRSKEGSIKAVGSRKGLADAALDLHMKALCLFTT